MGIEGKAYTVAELMRPALIIDHEVTIREVLAALVDGKTNLAVVVDSEGKLVGGISTLDVIRAVLPDYLEADEVAARFADDLMFKEDALKAAERPIRELIDKHESTVHPEDDLVNVAVLSSKDGHGRIIVVDEENKPLGILTRTEIKKALAAFLGIRNDLPKS